MRSSILIFLIQIITALSLIATPSEHRNVKAQSFPGWPTTLLGAPLQEVVLKPEEEIWAKGFPGKVGRFTDGSKEIVIRWVTSATRSLHPTSDCMKAMGYSITPKRVKRDSTGSFWNCFEASKVSRRMTVCEQVRDDQGYSWSDTSSWFWDALFEGKKVNYWAVSIAENSFS
jgi:hypothetical protein